MTDFHFSAVTVYSSVAGFVRVTADAQSGQTYDVTGTTPVSVTQDGTTQSFVKADGNGRVEFVATTGIVKTTIGGLPVTFISDEAATDGAAAAASAASSATAASSSATAAALSAVDAEAAKDASGLSAYDLYVQAGGTDTLTDYLKNQQGLQTLFFRWTQEVPSIGDVTTAWRVPEDIELDVDWTLVSQIANQSATPLKATVLSGSTLASVSTDVSDSSHYPSITTGNQAAVGSQAARSRIPAGYWVRGKITSMGAGTSGAVPAPTPRAGSSISSSGAGTTSSLTVALPTTAPVTGDVMVMVCSASQQPTTPTGWTLLAVMQDANPFEYLTVLYKTAGSSETAPALAFGTAATAAATLLSFGGVELSGPFGLQPPSSPAPTNTSATGTTAASPSGSSTTVANATVLFIYGVRFGVGATTSSPTLDAALTTVVNDKTSRTGSTPNHGLAIGYKTYATAGAVASYTADYGAATYQRAIVPLLSLKPTATPAAPGSFPELQVPFRAVPVGL